MKATFMYGAGDVRVEEVAEPKIEQPTDAIIRIVRACICGSDLHPYRTLPVLDHGIPEGHEAIAVVEEVGADVKKVKKGDFVIVPFNFSDGTCPFCADGITASCEQGGFYSMPGVNGLQAQYARALQADGSLVVIPDVNPDTADESLLASLLTLSDVYMTGYHAAVMGGVEQGQTVTVIGDGAVGLSAVLAARQLGAERVILMGRHTDRTDLGIEFGATDVVAARGEEGIEAVKQLTKGQGSHIVLEAVGHMPAYEQAVGVVRPGGVISRVGVPQYSDALVGGSLFMNNITLTGGIAYVRSYLDAALPTVLSGAIQPGKVFDKTVGMDDVPAGYVAMNNREALKVMVNPFI